MGYKSTHGMAVQHLHCMKDTFCSNSESKDNQNLQIPCIALFLNHSRSKVSLCSIIVLHLLELKTDLDLNMTDHRHSEVEHQTSGCKCGGSKVSVLRTSNGTVGEVCEIYANGMSPESLSPAMDHSYFTEHLAPITFSHLFNNFVVVCDVIDGTNVYSRLPSLKWGAAVNHRRKWTIDLKRGFWKRWSETVNFYILDDEGQGFQWVGDRPGQGL